jgi:MscS family membrane protein
MAIIDSFENFIELIYFDNTIGEYLLCAGILLFGFLFRNIISKAISHLLFKPFKAFSRNKFATEFDALFKKPIKALFELVFIYIAFYPIHLPPQANIKVFKKVMVSDFITIIFDLFLVAVVTWIILRIVEYVSLVLLDKASETEDTTDDQLVAFFKELGKFGIVVIAIFFTLGAIFKMNIAAIVTGLGLGGLAIALAAQETLSNLLASFIIFVDKPFKAGELINVDGVTGTVEKVGFRSTRIRTLEKSLITVPNKSLVDNPLNNITLSSFRRVKFQIGVLYGTSHKQLTLICDQIRGYLLTHPEIDEDLLVKFDEYGASSLNIVVLFFVKTNEWDVMMKVKEEINFKIMEIVENNGTEFAFPTQTLHIPNMQKKE